MPIKVVMSDGTEHIDHLTSIMDFDRLWTDSMKSCTLIMCTSDDSTVKYLNPYLIAHVEQIKM